MAKCDKLTEVYSRVCGYFRPTKCWNKGKLSELKDRKVVTVPGKTKEASDAVAD